MASSPNQPRGREPRPTAPRTVLASWLLVPLLTATVALAAGCRGTPQRTEEGERAQPDRAVTSTVPSAGAGGAGSTPVASRPRIVVLGDSLTAGYGLPSPDQSFPAMLQASVDAAGLGYEVVNMGVSGDTTAGGLRRLEWALEGDVRVLVVALGGNDGLRGLSPAQMRENLAAIVDGAQRRGVQVLLCGMEAPPNLGGDYTRQFRAVYAEIARQKRVTLLPFLLDGIAGLPDMNQPDGIHPNAAGAQRMAGLVWAKLRPMITDTPTS
jgi:acyl-CoA thioesterase-1